LGTHAYGGGRGIGGKPFLIGKIRRSLESETQEPYTECSRRKSSKGRGTTERGETFPKSSRGPPEDSRGNTGEPARRERTRKKVEKGQSKAVHGKHETEVRFRQTTNNLLREERSDQTLAHLEQKEKGLHLLPCLKQREPLPSWLRLRLLAGNSGQ